MRKHFTEERCDLNLVLKDELSLNKLGGSDGKVSAHNVGDLGLIPGSGRSPGEGIGYPLQYSGLENSMDPIVHGVTELDRTERLN